MAEGNKSGLKRDMGKVGILFAAVGSIIGSGWLFGALEASEIAGPGSIFSWIIGGILMIFIALCYAELGTMFPVSGGVIRYPHFSFGSFNSYTLGWLTWLGAASTTAIEVLAAMQYANSYLPDWFRLQHLVDGVPVLTTLGYGVAVALLGIFAAVNFFGIRWFMRLNNILVWWKIGVILLVIGVFMVTAFNIEHFQNIEAGGFLPNGIGGVFSAVATAGVVFSFLGFRQAVELAGETKNPKKNVPFAVIGSIVLTIIIYVGLQVAFIGILPFDALANGWEHIGTSITVDGIPAEYGPLAALAGMMGLTFLVVILYADAFISPADTALIYTTVTSRLSYAMGKNKNSPEVLAKVNKQGVPWASVILTFVAGSIFFFAFPSWEQLVGFVTTCTILSFGSGPLAVLALRKQLPDHKRPFKLPMVKIMAFLGFFATNLIVYWSGWATLKPITIAVVIGYVIYFLHEIVHKGKTPPLEFKAGYWVLIWIVLLSVVSYLGSYPDPSLGEGNTGLISVGWGSVILAVLSIFIMWLATKNCLSTAQVKEHLEDPILKEDMDGADD